MLTTNLCLCRVVGAIHNRASQNVRRIILVSAALCYLVPGIPRTVLVTLALAYLIPGLVHSMGVSRKHRCGVCNGDSRLIAG
jgi:hypothetical protein